MIYWIVMAAVPAAALALSRYYWKRTPSDGAVAVGVGAGLWLVVTFVLSLALSLSTLSEAQQLRTFEQHVRGAYEVAVDDTEQLVIELGERGPVGAITDFAQSDQAKEAALRIKELRDKINWYNTRLARLQVLDSTILGAVIAGTDDLEPIAVEP